jgi:2-methylcitrate dehydratase PrpD
VSVTQRLASFVAATGGSRIPEPVRREATRAVFNWIGCAVGGSDRPAPSNALRAVERIAGRGASSIFGHGKSLDSANAAFVNCISSSVDAFDDTDAVMMLHPTSPVAAAAFAIGEEIGASGSEFLDAVIVGMETEYRLCKVLASPPAKPRTGVYLSGLTGVVGAAAAVSKLLKSSEERIAWALAIAAVSASGQQDALSSMCCPFIPSNAARGGVLAAIMAQEGFNGSASAIEGPRGFANVFSDSPNLGAVTSGLGQTFDLMSITYKPYPCGIVVHASLDACLDIARTPGFTAANIDGVSVRIPQITIDLMGRQPAPKDSMQAQVSAHHWIAAALVSGRAGVEQSEGAALVDPEIARVRALVKLTVQPDLARDAAVLEVTMRDGRVIQRKIDHARGSIDNPMSDRDLEAKFRDYAGRIVGERRIDALVEASWKLPELRSLGELARLASR